MSWATKRSFITQIESAISAAGFNRSSSSSVNNCTGSSELDEKPPSERTELPQNIEELRRYSRQQGQEITTD